MKIEYFLKGCRIGGLDAQKIGEEIDRLREEWGDDVLQTEEILKEARNPDSPLHDICEWDDRIAADEFRKNQIRHVLTTISYRMVDRVPTEPVKLNVHIEQRGPGNDFTRGYASSRIAVKVTSQWRSAVAQVERELRGVRNNVSDLVDIADASDAPADRAVIVKRMLRLLDQLLHACGKL